MFVPTIKKVSYEEFSRAFDLGAKIYEYDEVRATKSPFKRLHYDKVKREIASYLESYKVISSIDMQEPIRLLDPLEKYDLTLCNIAVTGFYANGILWDLKKKAHKDEREWTHILGDAFTENPGYGDAFYQCVVKTKDHHKSISDCLDKIKRDSYYDTYNEIIS